MKKISTSLILLFAVTMAWGQNVEFKSKNFKDQKEELKTALDNIDL